MKAFTRRLSIVGLMVSGGAHAHTASAAVGAFYGGALHPLTAPEHLIAFLAFGLLLGQQGLARCQWALLLWPLSMTLGAACSLWWSELSMATWLNLVSIVVLGALVATARRLPVWLVSCLAGLLGWGHGYANGQALTGAMQPALFIAGVAQVGFVISAYAALLTAWLLKRKADWLPIAVRVAGSWAVAIGVLVISTGMARA